MDSRFVAAGVFLFVFGLVIVGVGYSLEAGITPAQRSFSTNLANQFYGGIAALGIGGFLAAFGVGMTIYGGLNGGTIHPGLGKHPEAPQPAPATPVPTGFCTHCGAPRSMDTLFCPSCGSKF